VMVIESGKVTIQHGPVASANMGAMTMTFSAPSGGVPRNVEVGDSVSFEFVITAGDMQLTAITPEASAPLTPDTRADAPPNQRKQR
jgi:Cu(I)/Ag(I) efflux system membrane fusion protein